MSHDLKNHTSAKENSLVAAQATLVSWKSIRVYSTNKWQNSAFTVIVEHYLISQIRNRYFCEISQ